MSKWSDQGSLTIRKLPPEVIKWIKEQSRSEERSMSMFVKRIIQKEMSRHTVDNRL